MPGLRLNIVAAKLARELGSASASADQNWRLSLTAKLNADERLWFTTGEDIKDVDIYANFKAVSADYRANCFKDFSTWKGSSDAAGILIYFPLQAASDHLDSVPTTLFFEIFVTDAQFADLMAFAQQGRYPTRLTVHVANDLGMKYGWEPDGSGKEWDTKSNQCVPIESVQFDMTIAEPAADPKPPPIGSTLLPVIRRELLWQQWTFFLVLAIGVLLLLRH